MQCKYGQIYFMIIYERELQRREKEIHSDKIDTTTQLFSPLHCYNREPSRYIRKGTRDPTSDPPRSSTLPTMLIPLDSSAA
jgi:hypothetical protein